MTRLFPGVDPYLEAQGYWPSFHHKFLNYWQEAISDHLPDAYEAQLDERVELVDLDTEFRALIKPDIAVLDSGDPACQVGTALLIQPETIPMVLLEEDRAAYIRIIHRDDRRLVAVLELLSPSNKAEPGRAGYLGRRNALLRQDVHVVELDLLVAGHRLPMRRPLPRGPFHAFIARAGQRPDCDVYSWGLRNPLPAVPVPLRDPDPDLIVDLGLIYATAFDRGRYARSIDRGADLTIPLAPEDRAWAEAVARGRAPA